MEKYLVIHGPNLNLLGTREPDIYGVDSLEEINRKIFDIAEENNIELEIIQSNSEGEIINSLHQANDVRGIIINPAAYTHYSIAIYDAIKAINVPVVEVHLSNIYKREEFRKSSITAGACIGHISGFGDYSYILGLYALIEHNRSNE